MATSFKKAGSLLRNSFRSKRYAMFDAKENNYILSPKKAEVNKNNKLNNGRSKVRGVVVRSGSASSDRDDIDSSAVDRPSSSKSSQPKLRRTASMTQSLRLAVGTLKQKLKRSSKRGQQPSTPKKSGTRKSSTESQEIRLYSPFKIDTPSATSGRHRLKVVKTKNVSSSANLETPTRLRREVESLTANMQALSALTPNTLHNRCRARKSSPYASRTVRTPRSTRKRIVLD